MVCSHDLCVCGDLALLLLFLHVNNNAYYDAEEDKDRANGDAGYEVNGNFRFRSGACTISPVAGGRGRRICCPGCRSAEAGNCVSIESG